MVLTALGVFYLRCKMKKRRTLEEILGSKINAEYNEKYAYIMELVESGRIKPVLASKKNGKKPA